MNRQKVLIPITLENALIALSQEAHDSRGHPVRLPNRGNGPITRDLLKASLIQLSGWFGKDSVHIPDMDPTLPVGHPRDVAALVAHAEIATCDNVILLATALREFIRNDREDI